MNTKEIITALWQQLYADNYNEELIAFFSQLDSIKQSTTLVPQPEGWYKDAVVYSLYVDLFNQNFAGLTAKLDYIQGLGVNCIWLLPILDSPMRDAGFDIKNYRQVRADLLGVGDDASDSEKLALFQQFLDEAHRRGIRVIFDIAMNHCSEEHPWFQEAKKGKNNPFRDYFIWSDTTEKYKEARLIFKGMCPSNWEKCGDEYYFHRFFEFQPDLNYRNPAVLTAMTDNLLFWLGRGIDGFRVDAIPYLWKEEGTDCENLPNTHAIVKFYRAVLDYVRPNTLMLAEACQEPKNVVKYFSEGDECHAGYHFPLMPQMFKALAMQSGAPIKHILSTDVTPEIPASAQWFTFLRCHDELSLELVYVSEEDRAFIHKNYCHQPAWDFRIGEGISARLSELMGRDVEKIKLIYSLMLTLPGTPIIYYGDEFGKFNDKEYYKQQIQHTGKDDTRFLVRGRVDWESVTEQLNDKESFQYQVFSSLSQLLNLRKSTQVFSRGELSWIATENEKVLGYERSYQGEKYAVYHNFSDTAQKIEVSYSAADVELLVGDSFSITSEGTAMLAAKSTFWLKVS